MSTQANIRSWVSGTAAVLAGVLISASPAVARAPAAPAPAIPGGFSSWSALLAEQHRLDQAAATIEKAARAYPDSGFAGDVAAPETRHLVVYWHGTVPGAVRQLIAVQQRTVPVEVRSAPYTKKQLDAEVQRLGRDRAYASVGALPDYSGLRVQLAAGRADPAVARAQAVASSVHVEVDPVPITAEQYYFGCDPGVTFCRENDVSPYWAGGNGSCTVGFAIRWNGESRLLTAAHCANSGPIAVDGGGDTIGPIINIDSTRDTAMVDGRGEATMWDGDWESTFAKPVEGLHATRAGDWVCTSGALSGTLCGIQVQQIDTSYNNNYPMAYGDQTDHTAAAGDGDSGGPVFSLPSPDDGGVLAQGIIDGGPKETAATCAGYTGASRQCSYRVYFMDVAETLLAYDAVLLA